MQGVVGGSVVFGDKCERRGDGRDIITEIRLGVFAAAEDDSQSSSNVVGQIVVEVAESCSLALATSNCHYFRSAVVRFNLKCDE